MPSDADFLAMDWLGAEKQLLDWRGRMNSRLGPAERIADTDVVALVALAGGAEHRRHHPDTDFHHREFAETCRGFLQEKGKVLPHDLSKDIPDIVCAWFPRAPLDVILAAARIHEHFRRGNEFNHLPWMHEKHALIGIGATEYSAFRMLKLASRDHTFVDPEVFKELGEEFRALARVFRIGAPDVSRIAENAARAVRAAVKETLCVFEAPNARTLSGRKSVPALQP